MRRSVGVGALAAPLIASTCLLASPAGAQPTAGPPLPPAVERLDPAADKALQALRPDLVDIAAGDVAAPASR